MSENIYRVMNTVTPSFNTTVRQMTDMSQQKGPKCLSEKKNRIAKHLVSIAQITLSLILSRVCQAESKTQSLVVIWFCNFHAGSSKLWRKILDYETLSYHNTNMFENTDMLVWKHVFLYQRKQETVPKLAFWSCPVTAKSEAVCLWGVNNVYHTTCHYCKCRKQRGYTEENGFD